jgi:hypothetical protein
MLMGQLPKMHPPIVQEGQTGRESVEPTKAEECAINPENFNVSHWECSMFSVFSADSLTEICENNP